MKTFIVPGLPSESYQDYVDRVSGMDWQFNGDRALKISMIGEVTLDGDQPVGSNFEEIQNVG